MWTARGSTRAWRKLRAAVLERDAWRCQRPVPGGVCGAPANTAGHITARIHGGTDTLSNIRAECAAHNYADGALLRRIPSGRRSRW
jgi:5-methylcytosine-specific restriction enzyme A